MDKFYIITKYVMARTKAEAIRREKNIDVMTVNVMQPNVNKKTPRKKSSR
jgi:hypothetical protein